jgi:hypothetical protein
VAALVDLAVDLVDLVAASVGVAELAAAFSRMQKAEFEIELTFN